MRRPCRREPGARLPARTCRSVEPRSRSLAGRTREGSHRHAREASKSDCQGRSKDGLARLGPVRVMPGSAHDEDAGQERGESSPGPDWYPNWYLPLLRRSGDGERCPSRLPGHSGSEHCPEESQRTECPLLGSVSSKTQLLPTECQNRDSRHTFPGRPRLPADIVTTATTTYSGTQEREHGEHAPVKIRRLGQS